MSLKFPLTNGRKPVIRLTAGAQRLRRPEQRSPTLTGVKHALYLLLCVYGHGSEKQQHEDRLKDGIGGFHQQYKNCLLA